MALPPVRQPHCVLGAHILADGSIATKGILASPSGGQNHCILTVCRHNQWGEMEHVILPGYHSAGIVRFEQLKDDRIVSASHDNTLKIRPLHRSDEHSVITLTGHREPITDMLLLAANRCITSSIDRTLKIWDLSQPSKESCIATLTDFPRTIINLHRLSDDHFLSESPPNIMLVWQLSDKGAVCTTLLDPDWERQLDTESSRTGREPPYDLLIPRMLDFIFSDNEFVIQVLPDGRVVLNHRTDTRTCHPTGAHSEPRRVCILARDNSAAVTHSLPICPVGPALRPRPSSFWSVSLLPDGRLMYADMDGTLHAYCPNSAHGRQLGNIFSNLPKEYEGQNLNIQWTLHTGSGRLLFHCVLANQKSLFVAYDPYRQPEKPDCPTKA